jgi:hypothetical protein
VEWAHLAAPYEQCDVLVVCHWNILVPIPIFSGMQVPRKALELPLCRAAKEELSASHGSCPEGGVQARWGSRTRGGRVNCGATLFYAANLPSHGLGRIDNALLQIGQKTHLAFVAVRLQKPRIPAEKIKHTRLLLRNDNERLYRDRR